MKYRLMVILSVAILTLTFGGGMVALRYWYRNNLEPPATADQNVLLRIENGMSSGDVARQLVAKNLIKNELAFRWYVFSNGLSTKLQAGLYRLHGGQDTSEIAHIISRGSTETVTVTIASGLRLDQIKQIFASQGFNTAQINEAFNAKYNQSILADKPAKASLEGYIFPDTYRIEIDRPISELVDLILTNTEDKITPDIRRGWRKHGLNLHQGLTLASIVQKEVAESSDQKQVAQVFLKRLKIGRKLEADPTFEYAAALAGVPPSLGIDSPYNTYLHKGLPPTPIATIELSAAWAVADPADTDWLFFLSDRKGQTHFTRTEAEHRKNIEKYLR